MRDIARQNEKKRGYRLERRAIVNAIKVESGCVVCGYSKHHAALHFHHTGEKHDTITRMLSRNTSMKKILEEIGKCVILCANCHAELHN